MHRAHDARDFAVISFRAGASKVRKGWSRALAFLDALFILAIVASPCCRAFADEFPTKHVIRIISPYSAGGLGDTLPRLLASGLTQRLGQQVIVENRPGASQIIGTQAAARSPADGYTLLFASSTSLAINPSAQKNLPYDPIKDFTPVSLAFTTPLYLVVNANLPVQNVKELVAYAKAHPGKLTYASGGNGSSNHLAGELFKSLAGVDIVHVPYKGAGPAMVDVMSGQVDMMFEGAGAEYAKQGKVRVLAVGSAKRSTAAPAVPTMQEAGVAGYEASIWFGIVVPAGTPKPVVTRLANEMHAVLDDATLRERAGNVDVTPSSPEEFAARIPAETAKWHKVIQDARIVFE